MNETNPRMQQFTSEIAEMKLRTGRSQAERALQALGVVLMIAGIALAIGAYAASLNVKVTPGSDSDLLTSSSYEMLAIAGVAVTVMGGFLFLRYSLARFLRFWLLRQSYERDATWSANGTPRPVDDAPRSTPTPRPPAAD
jgi:uncharacterized membrane protein YidH (DUF202 family)